MYTLNNGCKFMSSLFLFIRRLNDNEISVLEATGIFKKLPNLRKM